MLPGACRQGHLHFHLVPADSPAPQQVDQAPAPPAGLALPQQQVLLLTARHHAQSARHQAAQWQD